jgi:hypothetical protein
MSHLNKLATEPLDHAGHPYQYSPFPSKSEETVRVPMSPRQQHIHDFLLGKAPFWVRWKVKHGLPPSKSEARQLNAFMGGARQVSNTTIGFHSTGQPESPKTQAAFHHLKLHLQANPHGKALVYSSFKRSGLHEYKKLLVQHGIPHGEFSGDIPKKDRNQMVKEFNTGHRRVLLVSKAGGEGLDLKGTTLIQVMEPHWNEEQVKQVVGRGVRYKSHEHLPPHERHVHVQKFMSVRHPKGIFQNLGITHPGMGTDQYVHSMAMGKEKLNQQFRHILESAGGHVEPPKTASLAKTAANQFKSLQKFKVPLSPEERSLVMERKAVWPGRPHS